MYKSSCLANRPVQILLFLTNLVSQGMYLHAQGVVGNMITLFCCKFNSESSGEIILKIGQHLAKLWPKFRTTLFLTHSVYVVSRLVMDTVCVLS